VSMTVKQAVALLAGVAAAAAPAGAAAQQLWLPAACDIKPGHFLVNSGILYLRNAASTKFADQRTKDLKDANRVLLQAVTGGGQDKNPAAWYYLGRYYLQADDLVGADSALTKALALAPQCKDDIALYRRQAWVPVFNAGVQAWQAGNTDSAIASFRRANQVYNAEPMGFIYLANLFIGAGEMDSAAKYFRLAVPAASDPKYAKDRRDALFNVARVYHSAKRYDEAEAAYKDYLAAYPGDVQAMASLAGLYLRDGKRDSAMALYTQIPEHADSAGAEDLFATGQAMLNAVPDAPDTAEMASKCRTAQKRKTPALTPRQIAARCEPAAADTMRKFHAAADPQYRLAVKAYEAGLAKNPYARDALYNLTGISFLLGDTSKLLPLAKRLYAIDPMNKNAIAKLVGAWQLAGRKDSVLYYLTLADSQPAEVTISSFTIADKGATLEGLLTNAGAKPGKPFQLTFEFLDAQGNVVATQAEDVPPLDPGGNRAFTLKADGAGIVAWRYKRS
jgi:tetratricopeptide (TPR) repeat protein